MWGGLHPRKTTEHKHSPPSSPVTRLVFGYPGIFTPCYQLTLKPFPDTSKTKPHHTQIKTRFVCVCVGRPAFSVTPRAAAKKEKDSVSVYKP